MYRLAIDMAQIPGFLMGDRGHYADAGPVDRQSNVEHSRARFFSGVPLGGVDHDQIEADGEAIRQRMLAAAEQDGADAEAFGKTLAGLNKSQDEGTRLRALELWMRAAKANPSTRKKVEVKTDQRQLVLTVGPGELAGLGSMDTDALRRLSPEDRRKALELRKELKALTEGGTDGTNADTDDEALLERPVHGDDGRFGEHDVIDQQDVLDGAGERDV